MAVVLETERFPSALSLLLLRTKPVQGSDYGKWLAYRCHTCRERIAGEGCPCWLPKASSEYVLFSCMQRNTHTFIGFVLNECLMFKESTVFVGIFITTPFGKPSFTLAFCWFLCLLSSVFFSMWVMLRFNALLSVCVCCCAWLFGFKTVSCPFQKSTSTGTCRCSLYGFGVFGPRFFWRGYSIFQFVFKGFALLFWFICLFCAALDFAAIMIKVKIVLAVHLYCPLTFFLLFLL